MRHSILPMADTAQIRMRLPWGTVWDDARRIGLRNLIRVRTVRNDPCGRQRTGRYYISSLPADTEALLELVRDH